MLVGSYHRCSSIFQLQDSQQVPQPLQRANASSAKSIRAVSSLQDCSVLWDTWICLTIKVQKCSFSSWHLEIMISWVWWFWWFVCVGFSGLESWRSRMRNINGGRKRIFPFKSQVHPSSFGRTVRWKRLFINNKCFNFSAEASTTLNNLFKEKL